MSFNALDINAGNTIQWLYPLTEGLTKYSSLHSGLHSGLFIKESLEKGKQHLIR